MKQQFITSNNNPRLIIFFAGWGMDAGLLDWLRRDGYDLLLVYDYTLPDVLDTDCLLHYNEIVIAAWSMGVFYANRFLIDAETDGLPVTKAIAVNGTLSPIDDYGGIPEKIYRLTEPLPDNLSVEKFFRRICGGSSALKQLFPSLPARSVDSLRNELTAIRKFTASHPSPAGSARLWDEILLSENDLIFPPENLLRAWKDAEQRVTPLKNSAHAVDFNHILSKHIVDKSLVSKKFTGATETYSDEAKIQKEAAANLAANVLANIVSRKGLRILEIGAGTGTLTKLVEPHFSDCTFILRDIACCNYRSVSNRIITETIDAETAGIKYLETNHYDLIISASTIQWFNSPRRFLHRVCSMLTPGGKAFFTFFSNGTLAEIADIVSLNYPIVDEKLFDKLPVEVEITTRQYQQNFASAADALRHLRLTGVNAINRNPLSVAQTREILSRISNPDNSATLNFSITYLSIKHL